MAVVQRQVLVVDDEPSVLVLISALLRSMGLGCLVSEKSFGVLNLIAQHRPFAVLLDVQMPGLDGPALLELIRKDPRVSATKVILFSSMDELELAKLSRDLRADGYVPKVPQSATLERHLSRVLSGL